MSTESNDSHPQFSCDGRWLAYSSGESGESEIYVTSFPDRKLHPDGRRFVIGIRGDPSTSPITRLHLVHCWFAELERLAPTDR